MFIQDNSIAEETKRDHLPRTAHPSRPCSCRWLCWSSSGLSTLGGDPSLGQLRSSSTFPTLLTQTDAVFLKKNTLPGCGSVVSAVEIRTRRFFFGRTLFMGQIPRLQTNIHLFGYLGGGSVVSAWWWWPGCCRSVLQRGLGWRGEDEGLVQINT